MSKYLYKIICRNCGFADGMDKEGLDLSQLVCSNCHKIGTTIYIKKRSKAMVKSKRKWKQDDRVAVNFDGEPYVGSIAELTKTKAKVLFDDGDVYDIKLKDLKLETEVEEEPSSASKGKGFHQYNIKWDKNTINFNFKAEGGEFHGWWRKVQVEKGKSAYGIDIFVEYKGQHYSVETISYIDEDPREDMQALNADICAAINKWLHYKCRGTFDTIEDLQQRAAKPTITIHRLQALDDIILKLKEYRDTSIRSGGFRVMVFTGDGPNDPSMRIQMDLTTQALGLKGKVPKLSEGVVLDKVAEDNSKKAKGRGKITEIVPDSKNVQDLLKKLRTSKDKTEQRKIRGALRRMGHKGGSRSSK